MFNFLLIGFKARFPNIVRSSLLGAASLLRVRGSEIVLRKLFIKPCSRPAGSWGEIRGVKTPPPYNLTFTHTPQTLTEAPESTQPEEQSLASTQRIRSIGTVGLGFVNGTS